ncbi:TetR/AcrR family transcriptional regulator [Kitasatospora sp. NPDC086009]|uniref:TetR/AcrR family transcriptional regulator n=1 Tax=unclassified Kitasatospora TaxID=2633591 RepID=UPI0037C66BE3
MRAGARVAQEPVIVWTRPERGTRGPAAVHTRAELAEVAVRLADRGGLAAVSMRQVGAELGTGQASLYRYLGSRDDLLDLMTDAVAGEIGLDVPPTGDPVEDLVALAVRAKDARLRHPWLVDVPPEPLRIGPNGMDFLEYALQALAPAGLPGRTSMEIVAVLNALTEQFSRAELQTDRGLTSRRGAQAAYIGETAARGGHPHLAAALAQQSEADPAEDGQQRFERIMRRVLTGLITQGADS